MKEMKVRLTFTEEILGTAAADPELHKRFIASKAEDAVKLEEEVKALGVDAIEKRETSTFARADNGTPILWDYQIKGFFKDACGVLRRVTGSKSAKLKAYRKEIDGLIFIGERKLLFHIPEGAIEDALGSCQRPLRASTPQGDRVTLASSETMPAGSWIDLTIVCLRDELMGYVKEWLDYGELRGIGQWRNSGKGRFTWEEIQ